MAKPKIRFNGYTEDWEQRKLDDVVEFLDTMRKPLEGAKRISGPYPYYGASGIVDYVDGYLFDEELILLSEDGANITDRNYPVCFLASGKYWVNNHAHVLRTKQANENNFICNSLERKDYTQYNTGMAMPKLNKETCKKIPILCPGFEEQKKVGDYFRSLDHLITLHQRKCEQIKTLKKYMLQKMFPQDGEKVPQIRFEGFTEDWEQRKVLDLLIQPITDGPHETPKLVEEGVPFISVDAIVDNKIDFSRKRGNISEEYDELCCKKYKPQFHDVYLVKSGSTVGKVAIVETTDRFNIWSPLAAMRCGEKTYPYFLYDLLQTKDLQAQVADKASNGTQPNLSMRELEKFPVSVPSNLEEQKKIGDYFRNLDHLITLHQRKCDELKEVKKFMLQNMFV